MAFHVVGKHFETSLFFFLLCHLIIAYVFQKKQFNLKVADKGALLSRETLIWVIVF